MLKGILIFAGLGILGASVAVLVFTDIPAGTLRSVCRGILLTGTSIVIAVIGLRRIYGKSGAAKILGVFALLVVSTVISLVAAEFALRFVYRDITSTGDGSSYFANRWRDNRTFQVNRLGFRERDFDERKKRGTYRIAVVGDSFTYGQGIADRQRLTNILEGLLNRSGHRYEVLNFGRSGTETVDQVEMLRQDVLPAAPDFILLQWFVNDPEGRDYSARPRPRPLIALTPLEVWLHRNSVLHFLIDEQWKKIQRRLGWIRSYEDYMTRRFKNPGSPAWRAAEAALLEFFRLARHKNIPVGMILFPQLVDVQGSPRNYPLGFLMDRVREICRRAGVPCLDLRPVLAPVSPASRLWVNKFDSHPGPLANKICARAVYDRFEPVWQKGRPS